LQDPEHCAKGCSQLEPDTICLSMPVEINDVGDPTYLVRSSDAILAEMYVIDIVGRIDFVIG
jgi:hypothetical protein